MYRRKNLTLWPYCFKTPECCWDCRTVPSCLSAGMEPRGSRAGQLQLSYILDYLLLCMWGKNMAEGDSAHTEVRAQLCGVDSILQPLCGFCLSNSDLQQQQQQQQQQQAPLSTEPSRCPALDFLTILFHENTISFFLSQLYVGSFFRCELIT